MYSETRAPYSAVAIYLAIPALFALLMFATPLCAQQFFVPEEPFKSGLAFHIDNDLFVGDASDKDYTGGIALTFSGRQAISNPFSVNKIRSKLDRLTRFARLYDSKQTIKLHAFEVGFTLFTPADLSIEAPQPDEPPYASLFFLVNSQQVVVSSQNLAFSSVFALGALGLDFAEDLHTNTHDATGSSPPKGWSNQISSGGELTARYSLGVQKLITKMRFPFDLSTEFKLSAEGYLGYTTGFKAGFNARIGRIHSPWWGFNPQQSDYVSQGTPTTANFGNQNSKDLFFYLGANVSHQFYNGILQGQFRESAVTHSSNEIHTENIEVWAGIAQQVTRNWNVSGFVRSRTAELKKAESDMVWGGFNISRPF